MSLKLGISDSFDCGGVTQYYIEVEDAGNKWTIQKRFNDVIELDRQLASSGDLSRLQLPTKGVLGIRHALNIGDFNQRRKIDLNAYLQHLSWQVKHSADHPLLAAFLQVGVVDVSQQHQGMAESSPSSARPAHPETCNMGDGHGHAAPNKHIEPGPPQMQAQDQKDRGLPRPSAASDPTLAMQGKRAFGFSGRRNSRDFPGQTCDELTGSKWDAFSNAQPQFAAAVKACADASSEVRRFENACEDTMKSLRKAVRGTKGLGIEFLAQVPGKLHVWDFLLLLEDRRPFYKAQVAEVIGMLDASPDWAKLRPSD